MKITPVQNTQIYNRNTSFKSLNIHNEEYYSPFYRYASWDEKEKFEKKLSNIEHTNTDLRMKDGCPEYLKKDMEIYRKDAIWGKNYVPDFLKPTMNKYNDSSDQEKNEIKNKYNEMIESLGEQGKNLDIDIYPPPFPSDMQYCYTVYAVPALGLAGVIRGDDDFVKFNTPFDPIGLSRKAVIPSKYMITKIKQNIFNKLHETFEEGLKNNEEHITFSRQSAEKDQNVLDKLQEFQKSYKSQMNWLKEKEDEQYIREWHYRWDNVNDSYDRHSGDTSDKIDHEHILRSLGWIKD